MDEKQFKASLTKYFGETTAKITKETTEDEIKRIYAARSATYDEEHSAARSSYFKPLAESLHNALKEVKQDKPKDQIKIIDVGAGTGLIGVELKKLGYTNLCALDISAEMLKEAKKKEVYTEFICTSLNGQPIPQIESGQFDALICGGALIPGLIGSSAFVEMIRMVQTGGSFAGVYRGTGTDVFGEAVLWLIVGLDAKESFSRSFKASVVEEICPQCF